MTSLVGIALMLLLGIRGSFSQSISPTTPKTIHKSEKYLFYLHGAIIQSRGINAVSPYWGRYEYTAILDTLRSHSYNVISEARPKNTDGSEYADKIAKEIDRLLQAGVSPENISVVGASAGGGIAVDVAIKVKNSAIKYAVLGVCGWSDWKSYLHENKLCGNFLSIYEKSDRYGSCESYFSNQPCMSGYKEIELSMNNGHGFLYRPYREWIDPLIRWINGERQNLEPALSDNDDSGSGRDLRSRGRKDQYEAMTVNGDKIVVNQGTGLMWQHGGSEDEMTFEEAKQYVQDLNARTFAGYSDWRLPGSQEAFSLVEPRKNDSGLFIAPIFDRRQRWIWTADTESAEGVWLVNFLCGFRGSFHPDYTMYVRCVRKDSEHD